MAFGPALCGCCGSAEGVEAHHLYSRRAGCPDDLTVWLCNVCHGRAHEMKRRVNVVHLTTAALQAKKAQGALLGNRTNLAAAQAKGAQAHAEASAGFAANVLPIIRQLQATGATTYRAVAEGLNARGLRSPRDGEWHPTTVRNIMLREGVR